MGLGHSLSSAALSLPSVQSYDGIEDEPSKKINSAFCGTGRVENAGGWRRIHYARRVEMEREGSGDWPGVRGLISAVHCVFTRCFHSIFL